MSTPFGNSASVAGTGEFVLAQVAISPLAEAGTEITAAYTEPVQEGSVLVAYAVRSAGLFVSCPAVETVFDSQSNKWKQAGEGTVATSNDRGLDIWYCDKAKASAPPIVTARAAHFPSNAYTGMHLTVLEYAGGCGGLECLESVGFAHAGDATATVTLWIPSLRVTYLSQVWPEMLRVQESSRDGTSAWVIVGSAVRSATGKRGLWAALQPQRRGRA
jgi:hypothetical protein